MVSPKRRIAVMLAGLWAIGGGATVSTAVADREPARSASRRCALIATGEEHLVAELLPLVEVAVTRRPNMLLVEREKIDEALNEQVLSQALVAEAPEEAHHVIWSFPKDFQQYSPVGIVHSELLGLVYYAAGKAYRVTLPPEEDWHEMDVVTFNPAGGRASAGSDGGRLPARTSKE